MRKNDMIRIDLHMQTRFSGDATIRPKLVAMKAEPSVDDVLNAIKSGLVRIASEKP